MITDVQWWCSARGRAWTWDWQAYPGVWVAVIVVGLWLVGQWKRGQTTISRRIWAGAGLLLLWLTLDWPVGVLGTGYLASVHAVQFISLAAIVPPLLLLGVAPAPPQTDVGSAGRLGRLATQPVAVGAVFTIVMFATHAPGVVDGLMRHQLGAFALDAAWLASGLLFWWPVIVRRPERTWFNPLVRMLYVFCGTQAHLLIAMWLLVAPFPVYATYELAPRAVWLSALADQQLAGALMIGVAEPLILGIISLIFFKWSAANEGRERGEPRVAEHQRALPGAGIRPA